MGNETGQKAEQDGSIGNYQPKLKVITCLKEGKKKDIFEDMGSGIPEEIRDKILQPYSTTKKGTEGTGFV